MGEQTKIAWCDSTASPWTGCTEVSPGCANCYARELAARCNWAAWGKAAKRHRFTGFRERVCNLNQKAKASGKPLKVFPSLCDWLDNQVPVDWLTDYLYTIYGTPDLLHLLLTKRPENFIERLTLAIGDDLRREAHGQAFNDWLTTWVNGMSPAGVWVGTSCENQKTLEERAYEYIKIPAEKHFLSLEPLLGPLDFEGDTGSVADWVIVGGESGPKARACKVGWVRSAVESCQHAGVPVFVKQLGSYCVDRNDAGFEGDQGDAWPMDTHTRELDPQTYQGAPVRVLLKHPKGGDMAEWPADLRIQEVP